MNIKIREIYEDAEYPTAVVDANSYIVWANKAAREKHPELFKRNGLRELARFSDERVLISRLVKNGIGATLRPRQTGYSGLQFTLTPLPDIGKEMLLTVARDKKYTPCDSGFGTGIVVCAVPAVRDIASRVCESIDLARSADRNTAAAALDRALSCCSELVGTVDHLEMFADLSDGGRPDLTSCDTEAYFKQMASAVARMLHDDAPRFELKIKERIIMDHALIGRVMLILIANALEHGAGDIKVALETADSEFAMTVTNRVKYENLPSAEQAAAPFFSLTDDTNGNDRVGIGLTIVRLAAKAHGGRMEVKSEEDIFSVRLEIPSKKTKNPPEAEIRSETQYLTDRFSPVCTEMEKYSRRVAEKKD